MKTNIFRIIILILLFGTFAIIFGFSNQNGEESSGISKKVSEAIINIVNKNKSIEEKTQMIKTIEPVIRKLAHFSIYTVVGFLLMAFASTYDVSFKRKFVICLIIGFLYASSDEIHQLFINGRSGKIADVLLDTTGVWTGILICNLIIKCWENARNKLCKHTTI
jgi:VanZ family protein